MALLLKLALAAALLYALALFATARLQKSLIYFPEPLRITPQSVYLPGVEERMLEARDGARIIAWYGRAAEGQPTLLYFQGNAGAFGVRAERIRKYMARGYGVFMMTWRGYAGSTGSPSEKANVSDALLAYDTLRAAGASSEQIIVYGESLGSGVAVQLAAARPVAGVILDAPYTSLVDLAELHYPYLPARLLMTDRYESLRHIGKVTAPILIVHGENDDVIPLAMGKALFEAAKSRKEIVVLPGAGHSDHHLFGSYEAIYRWIAGLTRGTRLRGAAE